MKNLILFIAILLAVHASLFLSSAMTMVDGEKHVVNLPFKKRKVETIMMDDGEKHPPQNRFRNDNDNDNTGGRVNESFNDADSASVYSNDDSNQNPSEEYPHSKSNDDALMNVSSSVGMELESVLNEVRAEMETSKMTVVSVWGEMIDLVKPFFAESDFMHPNTLRRLLKEESVPTIENQKKYANQLQLWLTNTKISGGKAILNSVLENVREEQKAFRLRSGKKLSPNKILEEMKADGSKVMSRDTLWKLINNTAKPSFENQKNYASQLQEWLDKRNLGTGSTGN